MVDRRTATVREEHPCCWRWFGFSGGARHHSGAGGGKEEPGPSGRILRQERIACDGGPSRRKRRRERDKCRMVREEGRSRSALAVVLRRTALHISERRYRLLSRRKDREGALQRAIGCTGRILLFASGG